MIGTCCRAALALCFWPMMLLAQTPPELSGRVRASDGAAVSGALIELVETGATTESDANGAFRLRVDQGGEYVVQVSRLGWQPRTVRVRLQAGTTTSIEVVLQPAPVALDQMTVLARRTKSLRIDRAELMRVSGTSAAAALARLPGVVVVAPVPGGPERISVRGSASDQVLVLLDGAAINDPVTGEADLSRIPLVTIESITLLVGAQSAQYGAGALAAVVLIETRMEREQSASVTVGSLGRWAASGTLGDSDPLPWSVGASWRALNGDFDFRLPAELGSSSQRRANADARAIDAYVATGFSLFSGLLRARVAAQTEERGLPGRGYAPSRFARQELAGARGNLSWERVSAEQSLRGSLSVQTQRTRFEDPKPPFGLPYDDTVNLTTLELRVDQTRQLQGIAAGVGMSARVQRIAASTLDRPTQPGTMGVYLQAGTNHTQGKFGFGVDGQVRADYDRIQNRVFVSYSAALSVARGRSSLRMTQRTAFNPPALGDQFFRSGIGIQANPALRAERAQELEVAASWQSSDAMSVEAAAFTGKIDDLIVWAPDYRFVWSPQNEPVGRRGFELSARAQRANWLASTSFTHARITYDRIAGAVQVAYRPRNTAVFTVEHRANRFDLRLETTYIGRRTTAPTALNSLPGFWMTAAAAALRAQPYNIPITVALRADRLLDEQGTLIFGFPDPGRQLVLELRVGGNSYSTISARTSR